MKGNGTAVAPLLNAARAALGAGFSVVPPAEDGTKRPLPGSNGAWKQYQKTPPTETDLGRWYGPRTGLGLVCGAVSGGLELFEFDDRETYRRFQAAAHEAGLAELVERVEAGYLEETPGGGVHWFYVCDEVRPNEKLAERPHPTEPGKREVLVETRGEGGYAIVAPTFGRVHPSGRAYRLLRGGVGSVATLTGEERDALWDLARSLDEMPVEPAHEPAKAKAPRNGELLPGDDFASGVSWDTLLSAEGWTRAYRRGEVTYYRRPGKSLGISASTNHGGSDTFYCFSTSTGFEPRRSYSKFGFYARVRHGGDHGAAAQALAERGFGTYRDERTGQYRQNPRPKRVGAKPQEERSRGGDEGRKAGAPAPDPNKEQPWRLDTRKASSYRMRPVKFLSKPRLPRGMIVLIAGGGGQGKSTIIEDTVARLTSGRPCLGSDRGIAPIDVLMLANEDGREDSLAPRLLAAGADMDRVEIVEGLVNERGERLPFDITHSAHLRQCILDGRAAGRDFRLVTIDPITTYVGRARIDDHRDAQLKPALELLSNVAQEMDVSFLCSAHLNKSTGNKSSVHRVMGGGAYVTSSRLVFVYGPDPGDPERRLLASPKANIPGGRPPSLVVRLDAIPAEEALALIRGHTAHLDDDDRLELAGQLSRVVYEGPSELTADEVLDTNSEPKRGKRGENATPFLVELFDDGKPRASDDVVAEGQKRGLSRNALFEAKKSLGMRAYKRGPFWYWEAPRPQQQQRDT